MRADPGMSMKGRRDRRLGRAGLAGATAGALLLAGLVAVPASASPRPAGKSAPGLVSPRPGSAAMAAVRRAHGLPGWPQPGRQVPGHHAAAVRVLPARPPRPRVFPAPVFPAAGTVTLAVPGAGAAGPVSALAGWSGAERVPVQVAAVPGARGRVVGGGVSRVRVTVAARGAAVRAGADGVLLALSRADAGRVPGQVRVRVSYAGIASAYGGDFGARLALFAMPACALTTPRARACQAAAPVRFQDDRKSRTLTATVTAPPAGAAPLVLSAQSTLSGGTGDFRATSLSPASSWQVGLQSGDFTYSYPLRAPPPIGGAAPSLALSYDSQATDGETAQSNSQPGQLGEGFSLAGGGFIERRYASCSDHVGDASNNTGQSDKTGDECWDGDNAYLSLGGHSGQLIRDTGGAWHLAADDGSIVRQIDGGTTNGAYNNSHFEIITPDGTQYWFGLNELPGWQAGDAVTNSVWTVPVAGLKAGDPCNDPGSYTGSVCATMPWRWNLDLVVDPNGNATSYYYAPQTGYYAYGSYFDPATGEQQGDTWLKYTYGGQLTDIYYGSLVTPSASGAPGGDLYAHRPFHVFFGYSDRCTLLDSTGNVDDATCDTNHANQGDWPDVPWDAYCGSSAGSGCSGVQHDSPAFFDTKMLTKVATSAYEGSTPDQPVDTWDLKYQWLSGDSGSNDLALYSITHTGNVGGSKAVPAVVFPVKGGWTALPGRAIADGYTQIVRNRLAEIVSETGAQTNISYNTDPSCPSPPPDPSTNTYACFPQVWATGSIGGGTVTSWFNKYTVSQVTVTDTTGGSTPLVTSYVYCDASSPHCTSNATGQGAAWHYDTDIDLVPAKEKSYAQWRGYRYVHVISGTSGAQSETDYTFLRGMDSDPVKDSSGNWTFPAVTLAPSDVAKTTQSPATVTDANALNGFQLEQITYDGPGGAQVSDQVSWPWMASSPTAQTANQPWGRPLTASPTGTAETDTYAPLSARAGGGTRQTQVTNTFDQATGLLLTTRDNGDLNDPSQAMCTTRSYPSTPSTAGLINYPDEIKSTACGTSTTPLVSDTKYSYDSQPFGTAPTDGNITETDVYSAAPGTAGQWVRQSRDSYDTYGRLTCTENALGADPACTPGDPYTTSYNYSSTWGTGNPTTTMTTESPLTTSTFTLSATDLNPAWGLPSDTIDVSGQTTSYCYDPLGRVTAIWLPGQTKTSCATPTGANYLFGYSATAGAASYVQTQKLLDATSNEYLTSYQIYDSLLRPRQTQAASDLGVNHATVTDNIYDARGNVAISNGPYSITNTAAAPCGPGPSGCLWQTTESAVPDETAYTYDGASRQVKAELDSDGITQWATTTAYPGADAVTATPPAGGTITTTYTDARGRTTEIDQYHSKTAATGPYDAATYSYAYTSGGSTKTVTDAGGNSWKWTYDLLGREVSAADPDTGTTTSAWNDLGQLTSTTDAAGKTISWQYDPAGRKTGEFDTTGGATPDAGNQLAAWSYDTATLDNPALPAGTKAIGQLASETSYTGGTGGEAYQISTGKYSPGYEPESVTYQIPASATTGALGGSKGVSYPFSYSYNTDGTPATQSYPDAGGLAAETVSYGYDPLGYPAVTTGAASAYQSDYATDATYDLDGQPTEIDVGTADTHALWSKISYGYDPATRRLATASVLEQQQQSTGVAWAPLTNTTYNYDHAGNLTSANDPVTGNNQCYTYDYLARLTAAWSQAAACPATPATPPGTSGIGGPAPYQQTLSYDNIGTANGSTNGTTGRITDSTLTTITGTTTTTADTSYPPADYPAYGASHPHAPTGYTTTTNGTPAATTQTWTPDGQLASSATGGATTSYDWNSKGATPGQLASFTTGSTTTASYRYDASGNLLIRKDGSITDLFLPGEELTATTSTGTTITATRYYTLGSHIVAARTSPNATLWWLFPNSQGTTTVRINTSNQAPFYRYFTPYGTPVGKVPWWPGTGGYIGGHTDTTTGLTDLGAREYNPNTPAFISPDPVLNPSIPTDLNPYSYAYNNPATNEDPTGLYLPSEGGGCPSSEPGCPGYNGGGGTNTGNSNSNSGSGYGGAGSGTGNSETGAPGDHCSPVSCYSSAPQSPLSPPQQFITSVFDGVPNAAQQTRALMQAYNQAYRQDGSVPKQGWSVLEAECRAFGCSQQVMSGLDFQVTHGQVDSIWSHWQGMSQVAGVACLTTGVGCTISTIFTAVTVWDNIRHHDYWGAAGNLIMFGLGTKTFEKFLKATGISTRAAHLWNVGWNWAVLGRSFLTPDQPMNTPAFCLDGVCAQGTPVQQHLELQETVWTDGYYNYGW